MQSSRRPGQPLPVAQYLRMSTEHQRYSTTNQRETLAQYAAEHGMEIVKTYEDSGKSGLTLAGRPSLQMLLEDALGPLRRFDAVLVFDVSRWGRFQDVDESAYYEYVCRKAGVQVHYCAETFADVPGPMAIVIKSVKRAMAAEYSRELGTKTFAGKRNLARRGFYMGGYTPFGLRRIAVAEDGTRKGTLQPGEYKFLQSDRVVLANGNPIHRFLVQMAFNLCAHDQLPERQIARIFNWSCWPRRRAHPLSPWTTEAIRSILQSECYAGTLVWNRRSSRLKTKSIANPESDWVRAPDCFEGIISRDVFDEAQRVMRLHHPHYWTDDEMLEVVRRVYEEQGSVTPTAIRSNGHPETSLYNKRFGSLADACQLAGITPSPYLLHLKKKGVRRRAAKIEMLQSLSETFRQLGIQVIWSPHSRLALIDGKLTVTVMASFPAYNHGTRSHVYWLIAPDLRVRPEVTLVQRMPETDVEPLEYFIIPRGEARTCYLGSGGTSIHSWIDPYRAPTLNAVIKRLQALLPFATAPEKLPSNLAKRRRRVLSIKRGDDPYYTAKRP